MKNEIQNVEMSPVQRVAGLSLTSVTQEGLRVEPLPTYQLHLYITEPVEVVWTSSQVCNCSILSYFLNINTELNTCDYQ